MFRRKNNKGMSVLKVIELLGSSTEGWEDAANRAVAEASKTVRNIRSVNVQNQSGVVKEGRIVEYRVNLKVTFAVG